MKNWRSITCLNIILKVFTSILRNKIEKESDDEWMDGKEPTGLYKRIPCIKRGTVDDINNQQHCEEEEEETDRVV